MLQEINPILPEGAGLDSVLRSSDGVLHGPTALSILSQVVLDA